ncbi:hypothetical protein BJ878DRAFT_480698 [Calycina marina]|uniref:Uncharacterized protein n=1 Tax=Calycina marina TaxID=1763456 RepID=A0A9P8CE88_9HELO|nr:hypothetical protein BJ878DRAFT_480698 [Calycina marina]
MTVLRDKASSKKKSSWQPGNIAIQLPADEYKDLYLKNVALPIDRGRSWKLPKEINTAIGASPNVMYMKPVVGNMEPSSMIQTQAMYEVKLSNLRPFNSRVNWLSEESVLSLHRSLSPQKSIGGSWRATETQPNSLAIEEPIRTIPCETSGESQATPTYLRANSRSDKNAEQEEQQEPLILNESTMFQEALNMDRKPDSNRKASDEPVKHTISDLSFISTLYSSLDSSSNLTTDPNLSSSSNAYISPHRRTLETVDGDEKEVQKAD